MVACPAAGRSCPVRWAASIRAWIRKTGAGWPAPEQSQIRRRRAARSPCRGQSDQFAEFVILHDEGRAGFGRHFVVAAHPLDPVFRDQLLGQPE